MLKVLGWAGLAVYAYFAYHLLVIPALLDLSLYGLLLVVLAALLLIAAVEPARRHQVVVFTIGLLLMDKAFFNSADLSPLLYVLALLVIIGVTAALARWYGRLPLAAIGVMVAAALLFGTVFDRNEVRILNNFTIQWSSPRLYAGEIFDYFPLQVWDVDGDGREEIVTFGNVEEVGAPEDPAAAANSARLEPEPIRPYVFEWENGRFQRKEDFPGEAGLMRLLVEDYPGFPYYRLTDDGRLEPLVSRQGIVEEAMQIGTSPFLAFELDVARLDEILQGRRGVIDTWPGVQDEVLAAGGELASGFREVKIEDGVIKGYYEGKPFSAPTGATKIVGPLLLEGGAEGLLLAGRELTVGLPQGGSLEVQNWLTANQLPDLLTSEFMIADVDGDEEDEILISSAGSAIIEPAADGSWNVLWTSRDGSFRFESFDTIGGETEPGLIVLDKSSVRNHPLRYLSGYRYTDGELERQWKTMISLINVRAADLDGDGANELVASIYQTHKVYVFKKHNLPVTPALVGVTLLLIVYGGYRRLRRREGGGAHA